MDFNATQTYDALIQSMFANANWNKYLNDKQNGASASTLQSDIQSALALTNTADSSLNTVDIQAAASRYSVVSYYPNDITGLSGVLIYDNSTNQYIMEFKNSDNNALETGSNVNTQDQAAMNELSSTGVALEQLSYANTWYQSLINNGLIPSGSNVAIGGAGLGGSIASSLYVMYPNNFTSLSAINSPGIASFNNNNSPTASEAQTNMTNLVNSYQGYFLTSNYFFTQNFSNFNSTINTNPTTIDEFINSGVITGYGYDSNNQFTVSVNQDLIDEFPAYSLFVSAITPDLENFYNHGIDMTDLTKWVNTFYGQSIPDLSMASTIYSNSFNNDVVSFLDQYYQVSLDVTQNQTTNTEFENQNVGQTDTQVFDPSKTQFIQQGVTPNASNPLVNNTSLINDGIHGQSTTVFEEGTQANNDLSFGVVSNLTDITQLGSNSIIYNKKESASALVNTVDAMKMLQSLDSALSLDTMNSLLSANGHKSDSFSSNTLTATSLVTENDSISNLVGSLFRLIQNNQTANSTSYNTLATQENTIEGNSNVNGGMTLISFYNYQEGVPINQSFMSISDIVANAMSDSGEGMAFRYALENLNAYVLVGADYTPFNTDGSLDVSAHSEKWYEERAVVLETILAQNVANNMNSLISSSYSSNSIGAMSVYTPTYETQYSFKDNVDYLKNVGQINNSQIINGLPANLALNTGDTTNSNQLNALLNNIENTTITGSNANIIFTNGLTNNGNAYLNEAEDSYFFTQGSNNIVGDSNYGINNIDLTYIYSLKDSVTGSLNNLYVESAAGSTNSISASDHGLNTYNLKGKNTITESYNTNGTITFDGELLTGGIYNASEDEYIDNGNANITYKFTSDSTLVINNAQTQDSITINEIDATNANNYLGLTFEDAQTNAGLNSFTLSENDNANYLNAPLSQEIGFVDGTVFAPGQNVSYQSVYQENADNTTFYYDASQDILYLYDNVDNTTTEMTNPFSTVTIYLESINPQTQEVTYTPETVDKYSTFAGLTKEQVLEVIPPQTYYIGTMPSSLGDTEQGATYDSNPLVVNIRPEDSIIIPTNLQLTNTTMQRSGNDLLIETEGINGTKTTMKFVNYFSIGLQDSRIYTVNSSGTLTEVNFNNLSQYFVASTSDSSANTINLTDSTYTSAVANLNVRTIVGSQDENTINQTNYLSVSNALLKNTTNSSVSGNVITLVGGVGKNVFEFNNNSAGTGFPVVVKNFKAGDEILLYDNLQTQPQMYKDGNDLIINPQAGQVAEIRVVNYFSLGLTPQNSGIYSSTLYDNTELDLSTQTYLTNYLVATQIGEVLNANQSPTINTISDSAGNDTIIGNGNNMIINISGGNDLVTGGTGTNTFNFLGTNFNTTITDFKIGVDTLNLGSSSYGFGFVKNNNDLIINFYGLSGTTESINDSVTLQNYFSSYSEGANTGTNIIMNGENLTVQDVANLLNPLEVNSSINNVINESLSTQNTQIFAQNGVTVFGSSLDDDVTLENNNTVYLSQGNDVYHVSQGSGFTNLVSLGTSTNTIYSIDDLINGYNHTSIALDNSISKDDVHFFYDPTSLGFTITTGTGSAVTITGVDDKALTELSNYLSVFTSDGDNLMKDNLPLYQATIDTTGQSIIENTNHVYTPNTASIYQVNSIVGYDGNDILFNNTISTSSYTLMSISGHNIIAGGRGSDTIYTNSYLNQSTDINDASLVFGGGHGGGDNIYLGNNDVLVSAASSDNDTVHYQSGANFTVSMMKNEQDITNVPYAMFLTYDSSNNGIDIQSMNGQVVALANFWDLDSSKITLALTEEDSNGNSIERTYNLSDILANNNITQSNLSYGSILTYDNLQSSLISQDSNNVYGGALAQQYFTTGSISGVSQASALDVLQSLNNPLQSKNETQPSSTLKL